MLRDRSSVFFCFVALTSLTSCKDQRTQPDAGAATAVAVVSDAAPATAGTPGGEVDDPEIVRLKDGKSAYEQYCKLCHGDHAAGYAADHAPQLRNPTFLASASDTLIEAAIQYGRPGTPMAGFGEKVGGPLSQERIEHIEAYLRAQILANVTDEVSAGDPNVGASLFAANCQTCHGEGGGGGTAPSLSNPYFLATATDAFLEYAIRYGRPGTPMRGFGGTLTDAEISGVVRYVRGWARSVDYTPVVGEPLPDVHQLTLNPSNEAPDFKLRDGRYVSGEDVQKALAAKKRMILLDARAKPDWNASHIPGSYPVPFYEIDPALIAALPRDTWIVAYCSCPHAASDKVVDTLRASGFSMTAVIDDGFLEWLRRKYPVTIGKSAK